MWEVSCYLELRLQVIENRESVLPELHIIFPIRRGISRLWGDVRDLPAVTARGAKRATSGPNVRERGRGGHLIKGLSLHLRGRPGMAAGRSILKSYVE